MRYDNKEKYTMVIQDEDFKNMDFKKIVLSSIFTAGSLMISFVWKDCMDNVFGFSTTGTSIPYALMMTILVTVFMFAIYKISGMFSGEVTKFKNAVNKNVEDFRKVANGK